jgi:hypothetical protein
MESVFGTFAGLPVHVLVVHLVVVGIPLMSLVSVAVAARPSWRVRIGWPVAVLNAALLAVVWVAVQAGEALQDELGHDAAEYHGDLGDKMPYFAAALFATTVLSALAGRRRGAGLGALVLTAVAAVAATVWVVLTGHSGTASVWGR